MFAEDVTYMVKVISERLLGATLTKVGVCPDWKESVLLTFTKDGVEIEANLQSDPEGNQGGFLNVAPPEMTFEEFQATKKFVRGAEFAEAVGDDKWDDDLSRVAGYVYLDCLCIESTKMWPDGMAKSRGDWYLLLDRTEHIAPALVTLERQLYHWAVSEGYRLVETSAPDGA